MDKHLSQIAGMVFFPLLLLVVSIYRNCYETLQIPKELSVYININH